MSKKRIVVLGAGYGGVLTAKKLAKKFSKNNDVEITIIDKKSYHTMLTELHEVVANRVPEDSIRIDLKKIFQKRKVNVVLDEITEIDFNGKSLKSANFSYSYDYLVVGTGSKPTYFGISGVEEHTHKLWSYEDAVNLKEHILNMFRQAVQEPDKKKRQKLLTFVVVGGGFTGVEMIGELAEWKTRLCKDFAIDKEEVKLYVVDALPKILPIFPANLISKAENRLRKLGVEMITNACITEAAKDSLTLGCSNADKGGNPEEAFASCSYIKGDKGVIESKTVIWAAGVEGSDLVGKMDLEQKGRKRIATNDKLQSLKYKEVYVVGDNIFCIPEGEERPVPQMVENAEHSAELVAENIHADINGREKKSYKPAFHGAMVCIGGRYGVAHIGMPGKLFGLSGFFAMFVKHFINLVYFIQVAGINKCWSYLIHEIFHVNDRRSLVGGHFSKATPNFWLVPLRIFVGGSWLLEGFNKLQNIMTDPSKIFLIPAPPGADATSSASVVEGAADAAAQAVDAVQALPVPGFISDIVKWSMDIFFYTPDGGYTALASVFQTCLVLAEIGIGLALIGGLFTAVASIASVGMGLMIWSSGMAPMEMLWYMAAGIALIGGSGSTFGLDYYVLPFLKERWKNIGIVKKYYLYID